MHRRKIGLITTWFESGAGYVSRTYRRLLEPVADVFVFARGGQADAVWDSAGDADGDIYRAQARFGIAGTGIDPAELDAWIEAHGIELLIFNEQQDPRILYHLSGRLPLVAYADHYTAQSLPIFELYDIVLCHTERHAEALAWHEGQRFVPWSVFPDDYAASPVQARPVFVHNAGFLGLNGRKGTAEALTAFRHVRAPEAKLIVAAQVEPWRLSPGLAEIVASDDRIEWRYGCAPPPGPYGWGNVYLYPAKLDGIGLTVLEALAAGRPVIAPSVAPYTEIVRPNHTGSLVRPRKTAVRADEYYWPEREIDVRHLTDTLERYTSEPERAVIEGQAALDFVRAERSWDRWGESAVDAILEAFERFQPQNPTIQPQQTRARYEKPDELLGPIYDVWRPVIRALVGEKFDRVLFVVDDPNDGLWLRRLFMNLFQTKTCDLCVSSRSTAEALLDQPMFGCGFRDIIGHPLEDAEVKSLKNAWDAIVIWRRHPRFSELEAAVQATDRVVIGAELQDGRKGSLLPQAGYQVLSTPPETPSVSRWSVGIHRSNRPVPVTVVSSTAANAQE